MNSDQTSLRDASDLLVENPLDLGNEEPNEESLASIREAEEILEKGGTGQSFDSAHNLLNAVGS